MSWIIFVIQRSADMAYFLKDDQVIFYKAKPGAGCGLKPGDYNSKPIKGIYIQGVYASLTETTTSYSFI